MSCPKCNGEQDTGYTCIVCGYNPNLDQTKISMIGTVTEEDGIEKYGYCSKCGQTLKEKTNE